MTKAIIPKRLLAKPDEMVRAVRNGIQATARAVEADFIATAVAWKRKPDFVIESPSDFRRVVGTDNKVWGWINDGTKPYTIVPRKARRLRFLSRYLAKTQVARLGSSPGGGQPPVAYARRVRHPGIKARLFTQAAKRKYDKLFATIMQRSIDAAAG